jgi:hypothetical protein
VRHLQKYDLLDQSEGAYRVNRVASPSKVLPSSRLDLLLQMSQQINYRFTQLSLSFSLSLSQCFEWNNLIVVL